MHAVQTEPEPTTTPTPEPDTGVVTMERGTLRAMLEGVVVTMSKDGTRPQLNGVLFEFGRDRLTLVSTDGHRLTKTEAPYHSNAPKGPREPFDALIRAADAIALLKAVKGTQTQALEPIELVKGSGAQTSGKIIADMPIQGNTLLLTIETDANFPPYEKVIPELRKAELTGTTAIGVNGDYLGDVGKAAKHLASGSKVGRGIRWTVAGERDPIRVELKNIDRMIESVIVIMPMRI